MFRKGFTSMYTHYSSWLRPREIGWIHLKLTFILHERRRRLHRPRCRHFVHAESWRYENKFFRRFMEGVGINSWMALEAADITFEVAEGRRGCCPSAASPAISSANKPTVDGDDGTSLMRPRPRPAVLLKKVVRGCMEGGRKKDQKRKKRLGTNYCMLEVRGSTASVFFRRFGVWFLKTNFRKLHGFGFSKGSAEIQSLIFWDIWTTLNLI